MRTHNKLSVSEILGDWIESQLIADLKSYSVFGDARFDWSQSYGAGRKVRHLDGTLENFSRIILFDREGELLADGCMDFVFSSSVVVCYWDLVTVWRKGQIISEKKEEGIPVHVWKQLPSALMTKYREKKILRA